MRLDERDKALLQDMRHYALEAKSFVLKKSEAAYLKDVLTQRASERALEVIGEAASRLSEQAKAAYPSVPFEDIIGMRNFIAHGYHKIKPAVIWKTLKQSIPSLLQALDKGPDIS